METKEFNIKYDVVTESPEQEQEQESKCEEVSNPKEEFIRQLGTRIEGWKKEGFDYDEISKRSWRWNTQHGDVLTRDEVHEVIWDSKKVDSDLLVPPDVFKGVIKRVANLYSKYLESPRSFWVFNVATYLGNLFSQRVKLKTALFVEPRLFVSTIGSSADARKSESQRQINKFFKDWENVYYGRDTKSPDPNPSEEVSEEPEPISLVNTVLPGSAEGLISFLKSHPNSILVFDELRTFIQKADIRGSNLLQIVNTLFEATYYENITKDSHLKVDDAHLSFLSFSTVDTWESMFSSIFSDMGFINRLWMVPGKSDKRIAFPDIIPKIEKELIFKDITRIYESFRQDSESEWFLDMDADARLRWDEWYESYERNEYTRRLDGYGLRFMMIMCISEEKKLITIDIVERVIELLEWQKKVREKFYPGSYETKDAALESKIMKVIKEKKSIDKRVLYRDVHGERYGLGIFDRVLKSLEGHFSLVILKEKTTGAPKYVVEILDEK